MSFQALRFGSKDSSGVLLEELVEVLEALPPSAVDLNWWLLDFDGVGDITETGRTLMQLVRTVAEARVGISVTWEELLQIASNLDQIYEIVLFGAEAAEEPSARTLSLEELAKDGEVVVQLIDCRFWEIAAKERSVIEHVRERFNGLPLGGGGT